MSLNPARTYFWKATWSSEVRLVIQDGRGGPTIYNLGLPADGTYAPVPHYAYLGASTAARGGDGLVAGSDLSEPVDWQQSRGRRHSEMR